MLLRLEDINAFYADAHVLHNVALDVGPGEFVSMFGRNGVGKSTILKSIAGSVDVRSGAIFFKDVPLLGMPIHAITRLGIGYVPEERRIFPTLTAEENLRVGILNVNGNGKEKWTIERFYEMYPEIKRRSGQRGSHLSGGEQQLLTIGRTLMGNPELIMIDEPMEGLAPLVRERISEMLRDIKSSGTSILLVDTAIAEATALANRVYVISKGEVVYQGTASEFEADDDIKKEFLEV